MHYIKNTVRNLVYSKLYLFRYIQAYSRIFSIIKAYSRTLRPVKTYLGLFRHIQHPLPPLHIYNLAIFRALAFLQPEGYSKPCEILTRHVHKHVKSERSEQFIQVLFSHIQAYSEACVTLTYVEIRHIRNPGIFKRILIAKNILEH